MYKTYKGKWISPNKFTKESGETIRIEPYRNLKEQYIDQLPLKCFILCYTQMNIVKEVLCI